MLHSKQWLLGFPFAGFVSSSSSGWGGCHTYDRGKALDPNFHFITGWPCPHTPYPDIHNRYTPVWCAMVDAVPWSHGLTATWLDNVGLERDLNVILLFLLRISSADMHQRRRIRVIVDTLPMYKPASQGQTTAEQDDSAGPIGYPSLGFSLLINFWLKKIKKYLLLLS